MNHIPCVFSYDHVQVLSRAEKNNKISERLRALPGFCEKKLTDKIRANKEWIAFFRQMTDLCDKPKVRYGYEDIEVLYAKIPVEASRVIQMYRPEKGIFMYSSLNKKGGMLIFCTHRELLMSDIRYTIKVINEYL